VTTNAELLDRRNRAVARGISHATTLSAHRAENAEVWDVEGNRYIDFAGGIAVLNTGHRHPRVVAAIQEQLERFTHTSFQVMLYESYIRLAERLNALVPIAGPVKSAFFSTGAEATENAIKLARAHTKRAGVIAFTGGFHGRTALASALTGKVKPYKKGLGPSLPNVWHVPFPVRQHDVSIGDTLKHLDFLFRADVDPSEVAAIIVEPVQGEGGFHQVPVELMRSLRALCDLHGIALVADEIQTGFGRTGKLFAMEHYGVQPDLMCVAKSLAGGLPLSGVVGRAAIMDSAEPGGLGGTYGGNPLACAAALAILDLFADGNLLERANEVGVLIKRRLVQIQSRNDVRPIAGIRGLGAMVAFDVVTERGGHEPDAAGTAAVTRRAQEHGLILLSCGTTANTIRILVPFTASDDVILEGLTALETAIAID